MSTVLLIFLTLSVNVTIGMYLIHFRWEEKNGDFHGRCEQSLRAQSQKSENIWLTIQTSSSPCHQFKYYQFDPVARQDISSGSRGVTMEQYTDFEPSSTHSAGIGQNLIGAAMATSSSALACSLSSS